MGLRRLRDVIRAARGGDVLKAFAMLGGEKHLDGVGMSYGTKLLHFAAYNVKGVSPRPLILDSKVGTALHRLSGMHWRAWNGDDYAKYLEAAAQWAELGCEPADVEVALFNYAS